MKVLLKDYHGDPNVQDVVCVPMQCPSVNLIHLWVDNRSMYDVKCIYCKCIWHCLWPLTSDLWPQLLQTTLTPLHYAANFGRTDALRLLILEFGCDPNAIKDRVLKKCRIVWHVFEVCCHTRMCWPCTHSACTCCVHNYCISVWIVCMCVYVSLLLMQGSLTAFFYATQNSHIDTMRVLANEFKCSPDARGDVSDKVV